MKLILLFILLLTASWGYRPEHECQEGWYWQEQKCMECRQINKGYCICDEYDGCSQIICDEGYQSNQDLENPGCEPQSQKTCQDGCDKCVIDNTQYRQICTQCQQGYQLVGGICIALQDCTQLNNETGICDQCSDGFYFNWNLQPESNILDFQEYFKYFNNYCSKCAVPHCAKCSSQNTCLTCSTDYIWDPSTTSCISKCPSYCQSCDTPQNCNQCISGTYYDQSSSSCKICSLESDIQGKAACLSCLNSTQCIQCSSGYYNANFGCQQCTILNCNDCHSETECYECKSGYALVDEKCVKCTSNCDICQNIATCVYCTTGYVLIKDQCYQEIAGCQQHILEEEEVECEICQDTYYKMENKCLKCSDNNEKWLRCAGLEDEPPQNPLQPTQCISNYFLIGDNVKKCVTNDNTCMRVGDNEQCQKCVSEYQLVQDKCIACNIQGCNECGISDDKSSLVCLECQEGYYQDLKNMNCIECTSLFEGCQHCEQFQDDNNSISNICLECKIGYYNNDQNQCQKCTTNCVNCSPIQGSLQCLQCEDQYYLNLQNQCSQCPSNCKKCSYPANICDSCQPNYILQQGGCVSLKQANCNISNQSQCIICNYGFYLSSPYCLQSIDPYSGFVFSPNEKQEEEYYNENRIYQVNPQIQTTRDTTPCENGYYWTGQNCMPCRVVGNNNEYGYCSCQLYNSCDKINCYPGYTDNLADMLISTEESPRCFQANPIEGCLKLKLNSNKNRIICKKCQEGYYLIAGVCIYISNCLELNEDLGICTKCKDNYYLNWDYDNENQRYLVDFGAFCSKCQLVGCAECQSANTCQRCLDGYYWDLLPNSQGNCQSCPSYCQICDQYQKCTKCQVSTYLSDTFTCESCRQTLLNCEECSDQFTCNRCADNYFIQNLKCVKCSDTHCQQCINQDSCLQCFPPYLLQNQACYLCSTHCQECVSPTVCSTCQDGYSLVENKCQKQDNNCQEYGSSDKIVCEICQDTYYRSLDDQSIYVCKPCKDYNQSWMRCAGQYDDPSYQQLKPTQCIDNHFLIQDDNGINICLATSNEDNCLTFANAQGNCQTCIPGYHLIDYKCVQCYKNCQLCVFESELICEECKPGFYLQQNKCKQCGIPNCVSCEKQIYCLECRQGYYIDEDDQCQKCQINLMTQSDSCIKCPDNVCSECQQGYFLNILNGQNNFCSKCPKDCMNCSYPGNSCAQCFYGSVLQGSGCISLELANCIVPGSEGCQICDYGYQNNNGICLKCLDPYSGTVCDNDQGENDEDDDNDNDQDTSANQNSQNSENNQGVSPQQTSGIPKSQSIIRAGFILIGLLI